MEEEEMHYQSESIYTTLLGTFQQVMEHTCWEELVKRKAIATRAKPPCGKVDALKVRFVFGSSCSFRHQLNSGKELEERDRLWKISIRKAEVPVHEVIMWIEAMDLQSFEEWGLRTPNLGGGAVLTSRGGGGPPVLTSNFGKSDVNWIMKQSSWKFIRQSKRSFMYERS
jgi:hypothetical protein